MKHVFFILMLMLLSVSIVAGQTRRRNDACGRASSNPRASTEQTIRSLENRWLEAFKEGDAVALDRLMAAGFIATNFDGKIENKAQLLEAIRSKSLIVESIKTQNSEVRTYGSTVVVTGESSWDGRVGGQKIGVDMRYTSVWISQQ